MNKKYVRTEIKKATFLEPKKMKTQWDTVKSDPRVKFIALMPIKKIGSISYYYLEEIPINSRTQN